MNKPIGLTEFILDEERHFPHAKGNFTDLLTQIEYAGKVIASHIKKAGLADMLVKTGEMNSTHDEVIELDRYANNLLLDTLSASGQVYAIGSEEMSDFHLVENHNGEYIVLLDPLDGSSNTEVDVTVGTIFSIYKKSGKSLLFEGSEQVAAGYILYGTSVMFVYTCGKGVNGFTLDPSIGSFLLSHPQIRIPDKGNVYSINEANANDWDEKLSAFINDLRSSGDYKARYIGSMVADVHRTLLTGGIFLYPHDKNYPDGKLRLMIEINPMSYLIKQAGGQAFSHTTDPLSISPHSLHQRAPIALGSKTEMAQYLTYMT